MHRTAIVHNRHAWRSYRTKTALDGEHGALILTIEQFASRLAGGFLAPIDPDDLRSAMKAATERPLGELDPIKGLPGFQRSAVESLTKAWSAGLAFDDEAGAATDEAVKKRLASLATLEAEVLSRLPANQLRPGHLAAKASGRTVHARAIFGRIEIHGRTEMSPVWRPLLSSVAGHAEVVWVAGAREVPGWLSGTGISVERSEPAKPRERNISCASPRHEILEAFRWARQHLAQGSAPEQIAIATASPKPWDDYVHALAEATNLPLHFIHGRAALSTVEGQLAAALAEILLRGLSRARMVRFVGLLRRQCARFRCLPGDWWRGLPKDVPLLDADRWAGAIDAMDPKKFPDGEDHRPLLGEIIETLRDGRDEAGEIGEALLDGRALAIWRKALTEGPPTAVDLTLGEMRVHDRVEPGAAIVWGPAAAVSAVPRPFTWLVGLNSRSWPRHVREDPLLPDHVVTTERLDPLPVHEADRRDFRTICDMTEKEVVRSHARRNAEGRLNSISPLRPFRRGDTTLHRSRKAEHAATAADRLMARPEEFDELPRSRSVRQTWDDWHKEGITGHDGLVRRDHPLLTRILDRRQSATSLTRLFRDPLGYLWTYGFEWREPVESDEPLVLDRPAFGRLVHEILEDAVKRLESTVAGGFAGASPDAVKSAVDRSVEAVRARWDETLPVPPPIVWKRTCDEAARFAMVALSLDEDPFEDQRSWAEVPFGGGSHAKRLDEDADTGLPWDPMATVTIPGTSVQISGSIDRLDLSGDGMLARVTDYKVGKRPRPPPQVKGGAELQRCLYAFAVKALVDTGCKVETRLLYPREGGQPLELDDPEGKLEMLAEYIAAASESFSGGKALPGPAAEEKWYDLVFALPSRARERYLAHKLPLVVKELGAIAPLWEEP